MGAEANVAKRKQANSSIIGVVLGAAVLGGIVGTVIFHNAGDPLPPPPKIEFTGEYDDSWGRLPSPVNEAKVTHILISWTGKNARSTPKEPRSQEDAKKLVEQLWHQYRNNPTAENWRAMQAEYNEDSAPHNVYDCKGGPGGRNTDGLDPAFSTCGRTTEPGKARYIESAFGYHLIRREP